MHPIRSIAVVIPARNEEQLIFRCLAAVQRAVTEARALWAGAGPAVTVTIVADQCSDGTVTAARRVVGPTLIEITAANVGRARAVGIQSAIARISEPLSQVWIANTNADSVVPRNWLIVQAQLAARGNGMMIGTVRPDFADLTRTQIEAWTSTHRPGRPNGQVHGANLGVRADLYLAAGGFPEYVDHEDVELAGHVARLGARVIASDRCEVITSRRSSGGTSVGYYAGHRAIELVPRTRPGPRHRSSGPYEIVSGKELGGGDSEPGPGYSASGAVLGNTGG